MTPDYLSHQGHLSHEPCLAEFLLAHGFVDRVVDRREVRGEIARTLGLLLPVDRAASPSATDALPGTSRTRTF